VSCAGLVPVMALAQTAGLPELVDQWVRLPTDKGANPGLKVMSLLGGMVVGADSITGVDVLRHGGLGKLFTSVYAPSTLGSFLRGFTFGHVRQLDAVASRFLERLCELAALVDPPRDDQWVFVDVDDTIIEVYGYHKQGARVGYSNIRGLDALIATVSTASTAPVIVGQRLRAGNTNSQRGAKRFVADALSLTHRITGTHRDVLVRADSGFTGAGLVHTAVAHGAHVSVTLRLTGPVLTAINGIGEQGWTPIDYPHPVVDPDTGELISRAEINETTHTMFSTRGSDAEPLTGRLIVRRVMDANTNTHHRNGQDGLFNVWRFHAFFTTIPATQIPTVAMDRLHRQHAVIEQVNADLKHSALAHLPSGRFAANSAWLTLAVISFNLTRAAAVLTGAPLKRATTTTIRHTIINVPARIASTARRIQLHLPKHWPWETMWTELFTRILGPPIPTTT